MFKSLDEVQHSRIKANKQQLYLINRMTYNLSQDVRSGLERPSDLLPDCGAAAVLVFARHPVVTVGNWHFNTLLICQGPF